MRIVALPGLTFGAEVHGIDLSKPFSAATTARIRAAWCDRHLLIFRRQNLSPADQVRVAKLFPHDERMSGADVWGSNNRAALDYNRLGSSNDARKGNPQRGQKFYVPGQPEVELRGTASLERGYLGLPSNSQLTEHNPSAEWHTDGTDRHEDQGPPIYTQMYSVASPQSGGETLFASAFKAWELLPVELQQRAAGLRYRCTTEALQMTPGGRRATTPTDIPPVDGYDVTHPLCRLHPRDGAPALCCAPLYLHSMVGTDEHGQRIDLSGEAAHRLCDELFAPGTAPNHVYSHVWEDGDLVGWDNLAVRPGKADAANSHALTGFHLLLFHFICELSIFF